MASYLKNFILERDFEGVYLQQRRSNEKLRDLCTSNAHIMVGVLILLFGISMNLNYTITMYDANYDWYMTPCPLPLVTCQGSHIMGVPDAILPNNVGSRDVSECYLREGFECVSPYHYGVLKHEVSFTDGDGQRHHISLDNVVVEPYGHTVMVNETSSLFPNNDAVTKERHIGVHIGEITFEGSNAICIQSAHALKLGFIDHPCT
jgi:hypothetical protein